MIKAHYRRACLLLAVLTSMLLCGCTTFRSRVAVPPPEPVPSASSEEAYPSKALPTALYRNTRCYVHQVRWPEESLERVAQWYTGKGANWKILARATPNLQPNRLRKGNVVFIPVDLLQIETPMPRQYVQQPRQPSPTPSATRRQSTGSPAAPNPAPEDKQPQPYGPRPFPKKASP